MIGMILWILSACIFTLWVCLKARKRQRILKAPPVPPEDVRLVYPDVHHTVVPALDGYLGTAVEVGAVVLVIVLSGDLEVQQAPVVASPDVLGSSTAVWAVASPHAVADPYGDAVGHAREYLTVWRATLSAL